MDSHGFNMLGQLYTLNKPITFISKSGYNSQFMIIGGILYSTSGSSASYVNYNTGRGSDNQNPFYGLDNFKKVPIPSSSPIVDVGGGYYNFAYALLENGDLYTWGMNSSGQCGLGNTTITPVPTSAAKNVTNVYSHPTNNSYDAGENNLLIRKTDGYIYGCGSNNRGQLGLGDTTQKLEFTQITSLGTSAASVWNMGSNYGCTVAQMTDKSIKITGYNGYGQLGTGDTTQLTEFTDVTSEWVTGGDTTLVKVFGGFGANNSYVSLGMFFDDGTDNYLRLSGRNDNGQLGDTTKTQRTSPITPNVGSGRIADVAGIAGSLCVNCLKENGDLYAWGYNGLGQVGDGTTTNRDTPLIIQTDVEAVLSDGSDNHNNGHYNNSFIKKTDKLLYGCGYNGHAEVGLGHSTSPVTTHTRVLIPGREEVVEIGLYATTGDSKILLAKTLSNKIYTWGHNSQNGISQSTTVHCYVPTQIRLPKT